MNRRGGPIPPVWWIKIGRDTSEPGIPAPHQTTRFHCQKGKLLAVKTSGVWGSRRNWDSQKFPLKEPRTDLGLRPTHSLRAPALRQQLEGHQWHTGRNWSAWHRDKCWGIASSWTKPQRPSSGTVPFLSPSTNRATTPYLRLHQPGSRGLPHPGNYLMLCPIQLTSELFYSRPHY